MRAFGTDRIVPGDGGSVALECAVSKGWLARRNATPTRPEHPGTCVRWGGELFEVVEAVPRPDGGETYRLARWDDRHTIRFIENYDALSEAARSSEQSRRSGAVAKRRASILFSPLLGHLPADVQRRMEWEFGAPARAMTIVSALPLLVLGAAALLSGQAALLGGAEYILLPWLAARPLLAGWLFLESGLRLWTALLLAEPMGSVAGVLVWAAAKGLRIAWRRPAHEPASLAPRRLPAWTRNETFRVLEPIFSLLPEGVQRRLDDRYGLDGVRWGKIGALAIAFVALWNVLLSILRMASGAGGLGEWIWLAAGAALAIEQRRRWRILAGGRTAGSLLGVFVRPLAGVMLRDGEGDASAPR